jgi:hypothetical protein
MAKTIKTHASRQTKTRRQLTNAGRGRKVARDLPQTLSQAVYLASTNQSRSLVLAANALIGCPVGGWPETVQARQRILDELPLRSQRAYTIEQWVDAVYRVDHTDHYRSALV